MITPQNIPTPVYLVYEDRLRRNLELISRVSRDSGARIIMAFKANALWRTFPIIREYVSDFTASSLNELQLGNTTLGGQAHVYCPAYTDQTIGRFLHGASHITFNSLHQFERFGNMALAAGVSPGLRVNPQCSVIDTDIYNPALPGSRFGVVADVIGRRLPSGVEGLHFHALCESTSFDLQRVLEAFESQFGHLLTQVKWVNMGGGHLMTREGYDTDHLVRLLRDFRSRYPWLEVILEPGSAFTWRTGDLIASVVDVVENQGIRTAIIDASFACHMPDCLEMPYKPTISESVEPAPGLPQYRIGGNSCLSGDFMADWTFAGPLLPGQRLTFEDMNHYTTVKTTMFNGLQHPDIALCRADGSIEYLRQFTFDDYKSRMS
ncbi:carboxynorspermidine decarboxylase [Paramuribaculum intestinale]|uniref:carboxynorspermidine decarboxylase n=1 Tax=Paramuribaculum intestinale TaxID=2094151 RepID=UPI0025B61C7A|nr:carboxynorspermidine decarboxylase [Paramuribaculum intestinale]